MEPAPAPEGPERGGGNQDEVRDAQYAKQRTNAICSASVWQGLVPFTTRIPVHGKLHCVCLTHEGHPRHFQGEQIVKQIVHAAVDMHTAIRCCDMHAVIYNIASCMSRMTCYYFRWKYFHVSPPHRRQISGGSLPRPTTDARGAGCKRARGGSEGAGPSTKGAGKRRGALAGRPDYMIETDKDMQFVICSL